MARNTFVFWKSLYLLAYWSAMKCDWGGQSKMQKIVCYAESKHDTILYIIMPCWCSTVQNKLPCWIHIFRVNQGENYGKNLRLHSQYLGKYEV